jgi:hypothetical protein
MWFALMECSAFVNFSAVADAEDEDHKAIVFERADDAVVSYAVFPELAQGTLELPAESCSLLGRLTSLI